MPQSIKSRNPTKKEHPATNKTESFKISKAREVGLAVLMDEIQMAIEWDRPSILLAVQSRTGEASRAEVNLEKQLLKLSQKVVRVRLGDELSGFPRFLLNRHTNKNQIYFFSQLESDDGDRKDGYRALNLHRETLIENWVRMVVWLTQKEAADLVRFAPDFWAFRHRVVEFAPERAARKKTVV